MRVVKTQSLKQYGSDSRLIKFALPQTPNIQSSVSDQQLSSSDGPVGTQLRGVNASPQKHPVVILLLLHPRRDAENAWDATQSATAHLGKFERFTRLEASGRGSSLRSVSKVAVAKVIRATIQSSFSLKPHMKDMFMFFSKSCRSNGTAAEGSCTSSETRPVKPASSL